MSSPQSTTAQEDPRIAAAAFPELSQAQWSRLLSYGTPRDVHVNDVVFQAGDSLVDLVVIDTGAIEIVRAATPDAPAEVVARHGPGRFLGELNLLTGQTVYLTARVVENGRIHRISPDRFRRLMADDPELSDLLLRAFLARRELLRAGGAARAIEIVGSALSAATLALRSYAARQQLPHLWFDPDGVAGAALMTAVPLGMVDLPAVLTPGRILRRATPGDLAEHLGLSYHRAADKPVDLTIIGAGPAGLAAAVYGASEGLATVLLDAVSTGGQAAASSRIENYLGFPSGISGAELTGRAAVQALKFGAQISAPCRVVGLDASGAQLRVLLAEGTDIHTRAVVIATGANYRALALERWADFAGAGIYYAATELEVRGLADESVAVVGGANSAGQAALYLAAHARDVTVVVRGTNLADGMSAYLVDRLRAEPRVSIRTGAEVTHLDGGSHLEAITLTDRSTGQSQSQACSGLFCFIGAEPATAWLTDLAVEADGFIRTDVHLQPSDLGTTWTSLGRTPLPFETSIPSVFAVGDVRSGSMKRVAAAVGEGASAVQSVHRAIGVHIHASI